MSASDKFVWCLNCERTFLEKLSRDKTKCLYSTCDIQPVELWGWEKVRELHPDYPRIPERGKIYPLLKTPELILRKKRLARQRRKEATR